ncbi:MAG: hypothetical protein N4A49_01600 [Marinifilaceae bacterium]|jgi:hypothetical protein|nr:hypothetical protein [Marinifilaceae bacterium]
MKQLLIIINISIILFLTSCSKDNLEYNGHPLIEFSPYKVDVKNIQKYENGYFSSTMDSNITDSIQVSLVAHQFTKELPCKFTVLTELYISNKNGELILSIPEGNDEKDYTKLESTAKEGEHYNLISKGEFTIKSKESFGFIKIETTNTAVDAEDVYLLLMLNDSDGIYASPNYKYYRLKIKS